MTKTDIDVKREAAPAATPGATDFWAPLGSLRQEVDRLFDDFDTSSWRLPHQLRSLRGQLPVWPAMDLVESDGGFRVTAELPGLAPENVEVKLSDGMITIRGEKSESREETEEECHFSERRYGSFRRSFSLPAGVDADKITSSFSNGVLTVTLPKSAEAKEKERKIEVTAA